MPRTSTVYPTLLSPSSIHLRVCVAHCLLGTFTGITTSDMDPTWSDASPQSPQGRKKRIRNWTPDDRAKHKLFEKTRREAFNQSLTDLALLLPTLSNAKEARPSKHIIVHESLKHHRLQQAHIERLMSEVERLMNERHELLAEVNQWRQGHCLDTSQAAAELPLDSVVSLPIGCSAIQADVDGTYIDGPGGNCLDVPQAAAGASGPTVPPNNSAQDDGPGPGPLANLTVLPDDPIVRMAAPVPLVTDYDMDSFAPVFTSPGTGHAQFAAQLPAGRQQTWPVQGDLTDLEGWLQQGNLWTDYDFNMPHATSSAIY